jgi:hypothetical protein
MRFCSNYTATGHIDIYLYIFNTPWLKIATSTLNYTCVLTLMYRHGERLMYIVFDNGECKCKLLWTGLCSLRTATPHRSWYCVTIVLLAVGNTVCIRSPSISCTCTGSTVRGNSNWLDIADIFIPSNSTVPSLPSIRRRYRSHH